MSRLATLALVAAALSPLTLPAQNPLVHKADSLLRAGRVYAAETLYYRASRERPRDPAARLALGRYLAARGALKVGAVLMEEARYFGGDAKLVASQLAPVYARLGDYRALASLPGSELPYAERARAEHLKERTSEIVGPDSAVVSYVAAEPGTLGSVLIAIGRDTLEAVIDPAATGVVLDSSWVGREGVRLFKSQFDTDWRTFVGLVTRMSVGAISVTHVPARFDELGGTARMRIGLDVLARLTPTFDAVSGTMTVRRAAPPAGSLVGQRLATLTYPQGVWLIAADGVTSLTSEESRTMLASAPWTLDAKRGEVVVARE